MALAFLLYTLCTFLEVRFSLSLLQFRFCIPLIPRDNHEKKRRSGKLTAVEYVALSALLRGCLYIFFFLLAFAVIVDVVGSPVFNVNTPLFFLLESDLSNFVQSSSYRVTGSSQLHSYPRRSSA